MLVDEASLFPDTGSSTTRSYYKSFLRWPALIMQCSCQAPIQFCPRYWIKLKASVWATWINGPKCEEDGFGIIPWFLAEALRSPVPLAASPVSHGLWDLPAVRLFDQHHGTSWCMMLHDASLYVIILALLLAQCMIRFLPYFTRLNGKKLHQLTTDGIDVAHATTDRWNSNFKIGVTSRQVNISS